MIAIIPPEAWATVGIVVTALAGIATIIIQQSYSIKQIRLNAELAKDGREVINSKIDDNTAKTEVVVNAVEDVKNHLASVPQQRLATALAQRVGHSSPEFYEIKLPGVDYEPFGWSTGALVEWKSEYTDEGRKVRFLVHGPASIGFHFHRVTEAIFSMRGKLVYETIDTVVEINPGEFYTADIDAVHSATFDEPGEAVCHWKEQDSDLLLIGIYPQ